jgi:hypothetical protein
MRGWAARTRLRWRWREFPFETLYTTPEIFMIGDGDTTVSNGVSFLNREYFVLITRPEESKARTLVAPEHFSRNVGKLSHKIVCWIPLLCCMHDAVRTYASLTSGSVVRREVAGLPTASRCATPGKEFGENSHHCKTNGYEMERFSAR